MKKKMIAFLLAGLVLLLAGCGAASSSSKAVNRMEAAGDYAWEAPAAAEEAYWDAPMEAAGEYYGGDMYYDDYAAYEYSSNQAAYSGGTSAASLSAGSGTTAETAQADPAKLIYTADMEMETMDFDAAVSSLKALTDALGGYYESSSVTESGSTRRAYYTVRVPAGNYRAFLDYAPGDNCHVLSQQEYTEDVSESYYDTAGRLETQQTKLARLQELLKQARDMEDIIVIESAISETEEIIDRYSGRLRHYDALVDYSTVNVSLREVKVYEPEPDPTYGMRLGSAFVEGFKSFGRGLGNILIALAYSWLWLVLIAAIVVLVLWLTRNRRAAAKERRAQEKAARASAPPPAWSTPETAPAPDEEAGEKPEE